MPVLTGDGVIRTGDSELRWNVDDPESMEAAEAMIIHAYATGGAVMGRTNPDEGYARVAPGNALPKEVEIVSRQVGG